MKKINLFLLVLFSFTSFAAETESFGVIAPYVGRLSSEYSDTAMRVNLKEAGVMTGAYAQWINPKYFQANSFFYLSPKADMTDVAGVHLNADAYPLDLGFAKVVAGLDIEWIKIHTSGALTGLESFEMNNNVGTYMPRAGLNIPVKVSDMVTLTAFPYAGATYESVSGDIALDPMGPPTKRTIGFTSHNTYASFGANLTANIAHFLEIQGKYLTGLKDGGRLDSFGVLLNAYLSKTFALSYRFKHVEFPNRSNEYHLIGLATVF